MTTSPAPSAEPNTLDDSPEEIARRSPALQLLLQACAPIAAAFREADSDAERRHRWHKWCSDAAIYFGMFAVVLGATVAVWRPAHPEPLLVLELLAASIALLAVIAGEVGHLKRKWLRARNQAERYALLKFAWVVNPDRWPVATSTTSPAEVMNEMKEIAREPPELGTWRVEDSPPRPVTITVTDTTLVADLLDYYRSNRLSRQTAFFEKRFKEHGALRARLRAVPALAFYFSIACVFLHSIAEKGDLHSPSRWFLWLAIVFPVLAAAARAAAVVEEPPRNSARYAAKLNAIRHIDTMLEDANSLHAPAQYCTQVLTGLAQYEFIFESDHREWMRLMVDAEWF